MKVWQKAHALAMYKITRNYPRDELYGLTSQTRRAAVSVPVFIAEGSGRGSDHDFLRTLFMANGSAYQLDELLLLARDLGMLDTTNYDKLSGDLVEVKKMLTVFINKVRSTAD